MKKFALTLAVAAAAAFGFGGAVEAATDDGYPPVPTGVTVNDLTPNAGDTITVTVNCSPGENVTVTLGAQTAGAVCGASGSTDIEIPVPASAGDVEGQAVGDDTGPLGSFTVTVEVAAAPVTGLPATGSDGTSTTVWIASGVLVVGLGLFGAAAMRRRQPTTA